MAAEENDEIPVPNDLQPKTFFPGFGVAAPLEAHTDMQFFEGVGLGASDAWLRTRQRWASFMDDPEQNRVLDETEQKEMFGDRGLQPIHGMTLGEAQRKIQMQEHQTWRGSLSPGWGYTIGGLPPSMLDPVNVGSMAIGGPLASLSVKGIVAGRSLLAGAAIDLAADTVATGAASIPLEMHFAKRGQGEDKSFGEAAGEAFSLESLAMGATLGGFHILTKAARSAMDGYHFDYTIADVERAAARGGYADRPPDVMAAEQMAHDDRVAPPPVSIAPREMAPTVRLKDMFSEYPGGVGQWVRDLGDGITTAFEHADKIGIDPQSPAMRGFLDDAVAQTQKTHQNTPEAAEAAAEPVPKPPQSVLDGAPKYGLAGKSFDVAFSSPVDKALYMSKGNAEAAQWLRDSGMTSPQIKEAAAKVRGEIRARVVQANKEGVLRASLPEVHVLPQQKARREFIEKGGKPPSRPASFSARKLISAIETSRVMKPHSRLPEPAILPDDAAIRSLADPPDLPDLLKDAQSAGVDVNELRGAMDEITREMSKCRP